MSAAEQEVVDRVDRDLADRIDTEAMKMSLDLLREGVNRNGRDIAQVAKSVETLAENTKASLESIVETIRQDNDQRHKSAQTLVKAGAAIVVVSLLAVTFLASGDSIRLSTAAGSVEFGESSEEAP